ncbi:MAG: hypothetical protein OEU84_08825 [Xanthomonadales bacterium]|nr:hypothetical protein [Xanthomonadales bacterium]
MNIFKLVPVSLILFAVSAQANPVDGELTEFHSPGGLDEQCVQIHPMPGARYSKNDRKSEAEYCKLDLYQLALCPKLWSTSPGTILYEIDLDAYEGSPKKFEQEHCASGHHARDAARHKPAIFKISVNDRDTSATYAPSSWVYYHFSRFFDVGIHVPVAVYRSMDAEQHNARVVKPALGVTAGHRNLRMLAAGWQFLNRLETGGDTPFGSQSAALTDDGRQVFGVLLHNKGDRYGPEVNGTRESGWGVGQNHDFQMTAPYLALRSELPVQQAARQAIHEARGNQHMAKALPADVAVEQVVFWMKDVLEIALLDTLLGQQDRIGNIDYNWRWYWIEEGELEDRAAHGKEPPKKAQQFKPVRLRQSAINDNDAGVRRGYANFAQKSAMLEGLRHFHPGLYQRLGELANDLGSKGPIYGWLTGAAGLSQKEADAIATRAVRVFGSLKADCQSSQLKLDLDPARFLGADNAFGNVSCDVKAP